MTQEIPLAAAAATELPLSAVQPRPIDELAPVPDDQRIGVLDVLRGFALIGILMMNIEWFNRATVLLTMPDMALQGADHAAGFLVKVFVEGKFYKLFSLLFGMGFAVMLLRAEKAGRPFYAWFSRRAAVLFVFGMLHSIFFWTGDILHDYAIGAFALLGILWLRQGGKAGRNAYALPISLLMIGAATHALIAKDPMALIGYAVVSALVALFVWMRGRDLWRFFRNPQWLLRIAIAMSIFPILMMSTFGIVNGASRDPQELQERYQKSEAKRVELTAAWPKREAEAMVEARKIAPGEFGELDDGDEDDDQQAKDSKKPVATKTKPGNSAAPETKTADADAAAARSKSEEHDEIASVNWFDWKENQVKAVFWETQAMTSSDYWVATHFRWIETLHALPGAPFFAFFLLMPIFMFGWWLVETGKIGNPEQHLGLFRALAWVGWPFGLAFSMSSAVLIYQPNFIEGRGSDMLPGLLGWCGQILLCAAYVGSFVLLLRKRFFQRAFAWLAPLGRMALTNYLTHSLVLSLLFFGYGAGWFGHVQRFQQMGLVLAIITTQAILSRVWLNHFNYGPMEWLWRSATYMKWQPLRRSATTAGASAGV